MILILINLKLKSKYKIGIRQTRIKSNNFILNYYYIKIIFYKKL